MTTLETIDTPRLSLVIGGQAAPQQRPQPQQPQGQGDPQQGAQQPAAGGGLNDIFAMFQQGIQLASGFLGGLQQILASIQGFSQMAQGGQGGQPQGGDQQPDTQAA